MSKPHVIAILCSDLHLTLQAPACRAETDWLEVQAGYLKQLQTLAKDKIPILCAGDIFDRWNAPAELINFALDHLPDGMICVPGQHDLPNHRRDLMHRSGYGVLVKAGKITDISVGHVHCGEGFNVHGFGWEEDIVPVSPQALEIALIHRYMWVAGASYPGAPTDSQLSAFNKQLRGYDVAVIGDNHLHFTALAGKQCRVFNCGGFIRRKSDEIDRKPTVGLLMSDGSVKAHQLQTAADRFHKDMKKREEIPVNMKEFLDSLEGLGEQALDFRAAVRQHLQNSELETPVKKLIEEIMSKT